MLITCLSSEIYIKDLVRHTTRLAPRGFPECIHPPSPLSWNEIVVARDTWKLPTSEGSSAWSLLCASHLLKQTVCEQSPIIWNQVTDDKHNDYSVYHREPPRSRRDSNHRSGTDPNHASHFAQKERGMVLTPSRPNLHAPVRNTNCKLIITEEIRRKTALSWHCLAFLCFLSNNVLIQFSPGWSQTEKLLLLVLLPGWLIWQITAKWWGQGIDSKVEGDFLSLITKIYNLGSENSLVVNF